VQPESGDVAIWAARAAGLSAAVNWVSEAGVPMRLAALRQFALSLPHTTWVKQWGECLVFKVAGKMFLLLALDAETIDGVVFKCTPDEFDDLTDIDGITQAPYCAKRHWVRVGDLAALPAAELEKRIQRSYDLVVAKLPKKTQAALKLAAR
jgi:predicted DNA-binding protein (MmcQ/YjbR family)